MQTVQGQPGSPVEVQLKSLLFYQEKGIAVIVLEGPAGKWGLPILAKSSEVASIALALQGKEPVRPLAHDLLASILKEAEARVLHVLIDILEEPVCHGIIAVHFHNQELDFDSRPSDAISLAIRTHVPIYVSPAVISQGAIHFDRGEWPADLAGKAKLEN